MNVSHSTMQGLFLFPFLEALINAFKSLIFYSCWVYGALPRGCLSLFGFNVVVFYYYNCLSLYESDYLQVLRWKQVHFALIPLFTIYHTQLQHIVCCLLTVLDGILHSLEREFDLHWVLHSELLPDVLLITTLRVGFLFSFCFYVIPWYSQ